MKNEFFGLGCFQFHEFKFLRSIPIGKYVGFLTSFHRVRNKLFFHLTTQGTGNGRKTQRITSIAWICETHQNRVSNFCYCSRPLGLSDSIDWGLIVSKKVFDCFLILVGNPGAKCCAMCWMASSSCRSLEIPCRTAKTLSTS